jgi:alginate O-acetyltransferase complex protein AlgI
MFGFHFLENFNYPFIAKSITDFWRRWHMSLSSFFRDYIYIPLGGNRVSDLKWIRNLFVVWFLTGFWHGAAWNFIIWGLYFAVLLVLEKKIWGKYLEKTRVFKCIYTLFFVIISFTIFNSNSLTELSITLKNMFLINKIDFINEETIYHFRNYIIVLIIAVVASTPLIKNIFTKIKNNKLISVFEIIYYFGLLIIITAFLIDSSFNPFLYFRF